MPASGLSTPLAVRYGMLMGHSVADIAAALGAEAVGDVSLIVERPANPALAGADDLALAMSEDYSEAVAASDAQAAVLWPDADWQALGLKAAIFVPRPRYAMAGLTTAFDVPWEINLGVHPSAIIDPTADVAPDAAIGPFVVIGARACIGAGARIHPHCMIAEDAIIGADAMLHAGVRIGRRVKIGERFRAASGASIGGDGFSFVTPEKGIVEEVKDSRAISSDQRDQGYVWIHSLGSVEIGDDVFIGANTVIDRGTVINTRIGDGTKIDSLVMIGHNVQIGRHCLFCSQVGLAGSVEVGDRVVLTGQVGVGDHIVIGDNVVAAGQTGIGANVPPNRVIMGSPAFKMDDYIESYRRFRRLPRLVSRIEALEKLVSKEKPSR